MRRLATLCSELERKTNLQYDPELKGGKGIHHHCISHIYFRCFYTDIEANNYCTELESNRLKYSGGTLAQGENDKLVILKKLYESEINEKICSQNYQEIINQIIIDANELEKMSKDILAILKDLAGYPVFPGLCEKLLIA